MRNLVREGKTRQLRNVMTMSIGDGMQTLEMSLSELVRVGLVSYQDACLLAPRPDEVEVGWTSNSFFPAHPVHPGTRLVFHFWKPGVNFLQYYQGETPEPLGRIPKSAFGFSVPMRVVGITVTPQDIPEAPYFLPPLTTVRQDFDEVGSRSVRLLLRMIDTGEALPSAPRVEPQLIVRESTDVARPK